jgi:hypothetical protein
MYKITANLQTITAYYQKDNATKESFRLRIGETAVGTITDGNWFYCQRWDSVKKVAWGDSGWLDKRKGLFVPTTDTIPIPPSETEKDLVWIKGYWDLFGVDYVTNRYGDGLPGLIGLPAAIKLGTTRRVDISPGTDTRKLWYEIFSAHAPEWMLTTKTDNNARFVVEQRFVGLLKNGVCYTDGAGNTGFNQVITSNNYAYDMKLKKNFAGVLHRAIRMLKIGSYASMKAQVAKYPYLVTNATISNREYDGRGVQPFWHLDGYNHVKVPMFCYDEINWIPDMWIEQVPEGQTRESYFPHREMEASG